MSATTISSFDAGFWIEEPASRPDRARIRARIAGMHCSLCTGTIEKALGRHAGVDKVAVSLTHEQALVVRVAVGAVQASVTWAFRSHGARNLRRALHVSG